MVSLETYGKQLWIPEGFAHGFLALSDSAEVLYKTTNFYNKLNERCIIWNDTTLNINWPADIEIKLSSRDRLGKSVQFSELFI
jgi:dTDP-4-dehydrorhamnose 3,5-epimerase